MTLDQILRLLYRRVRGILLSILLTAGALFSPMAMAHSEMCMNIFSDTGSAKYGERLFDGAEVPPPKFSVEDLLPAELIARLKQLVPDIILTAGARRNSYDSELGISIGVFATQPGNSVQHPLMSANLTKSGPETLTIDWVIFSDIAVRNGKLIEVEDANRQGFSLKNFGDMLVKFIEISKSEGMRYIVAGVPASYMVATLYRFKGFVPIDAAAVAHYEKIDAIYKKAKQILPEGIRPRGVSDFSDMIGNMVVPSVINKAIKNGKVFYDGAELFAVQARVDGKDTIIFVEKDAAGKYTYVTWKVDNELILEIP